MRSVIALAVLALSTSAVSPNAPQAAPESFSVVLNYTPTGWSVHCEIGCAWTAGFECKDACNAMVDARGVITLANNRPLDPKFAFKVERTDDGVLALARSGTSWTRLSWGCASQPCRARITDTGVTLLR